MLTLRELERAVGALVAQRHRARLDRVVQPDEMELVLSLHGGDQRAADDPLWLLLSCRPGFARLSALPEARRGSSRPSALVQYLRAHGRGSHLGEVRLRGGDRLAELRFLGRPEPFSLVLSILGPRSNLYLLDARDRLVACARPLAQTRRDLVLGEPWREPATPPPPPGQDRFAEIPEAELLAAIEAHYAGAEQLEDRDRLRSRMAQALRKQAAALRRKARHLEEDAASARQAPELLRLGELLKANLGSLRPGQESVEVRDFSSGEPVRIPLDPRLSPARNLEALFKRARKAQRRGQKAAQGLATLEERRRELERLQAQLEGCSDEESLRSLAARPEVERLLARYASRAPNPPEQASRRKVWKLGRRELPPRLTPRRYRTRDGLEVWVGRNDEGNDLLTTRLARGRDLFLHLEGSPGSHVVLRTEGRDDPPQESLLEAAELAVQFSKQRRATRARVHVAAIKDVSKPSGAKPGLVLVHRGRSFTLRRSPERLKRILESRLDD